MLLHEPYLLSLLGLMLVTTAVTWVLPPPIVSAADVSPRQIRAVARAAATAEGTLESLDVDAKTLVLSAGDRLQKYSLSTTVAVTRDSREIEVSMLAEGDFVVLTFASESNELVTRIQAISRK